jgi:uncharacterized surface protein with fasciclin (FAS1) repeats
MKKNLFPTKHFLVGTMLLSSVLLFTACKKDDDPAPSANNIATIVSTNASFSTLYAGLQAAKLTDTFKATGPFTVFAPDNDAFSKLTLNASNIGAVQGLSNILLYHTIKGSKITAAQVPAGPNAKVVTASGDSVFVTKNTAGVYINGIKVKQADVDATNGVVHVIERVLLPPAGNIVQVAQLDTTFKLLVQAVVKCNLQGVLSGPSIFTVFAPTNTAFKQAGFDSAAIANATPATIATLSTVLKYHVISGRVFSSDLSEGLQPAMLDGGKTTITLAGGAKVKGTTNTTASNIVVTDVMARNGVVHVIDRVLLP